MPFIAGLGTLNSRRIVRLPSAPTSVSTSINGVGSISVSYGAPSDIGGTAILKYQYSTNGGSTWTDAPSSPFSLTGLGNGTAVTVVMRAVNMAGDGSTASSSITTATAPSAPTSFAMINDDNTVDWGWAAPSSNGGLAVTSYQYSVSTNGGAYPGNTSLTNSSTWFDYPDTISNYRNTNYYKLRVRACNAVDCGPYVESSNSTPWSVSTGSNYQANINYDSYTNSGCSSECCGDCGTQAKKRRKYRYQTLRDDTWTRGASSNVQSGILVADYPDWASVTTYTACENDGGCSSVTRTAYSATGDGQVIPIQSGQYATWSSYWGHWYRSDSNGAAVTCGTGGCGQACLQVTNSIGYCSAGGCQTYTRTADWTGWTLCCSMYGCYGSSCTPSGC